MGTNPNPAVEAEFGPLRARRAPIAEAAMTGMAVGAAGIGMRPVVYWRSATFSFVGFDQAVNQASRIRYMFGGQQSFPIVFRASYENGTRTAAQHSQTGYAMYAHAGGLKIVVPSNPADAKGLLLAALRDDDPVVFFEPARLAAVTGEVHDGDEAIPLGQAAIVRPGDDVTIVAIGYMVSVALEAADELVARGVSAEVVDLRSLVPLDSETVLDSVRRTGRLVVADESFPTCSIASEVLALVAESDVSMRLRAPARRVCTAPVPVPFSPPLEDFVLPDAARVRDAVLSTLDPGLTPGAAVASASR